MLLNVHVSICCGKSVSLGNLLITYSKLLALVQLIMYMLYACSVSRVCQIKQGFNK